MEYIELIRLNIQVQKELRNELKKQALFRNMTLRDYITNILIDAAIKEQKLQQN